MLVPNAGLNPEMHIVSACTLSQEFAPNEWANVGDEKVMFIFGKYCTSITCMFTMRPPCTYELTPALFSHRVYGWLRGVAGVCYRQPLAGQNS